MKKQFLALLCIFAINGIAIADNTQTRLKAMEAERDSVVSTRAQAKPIFQKTALNSSLFGDKPHEQGTGNCAIIIGWVLRLGQRYNER